MCICALNVWDNSQPRPTKHRLEMALHVLLWWPRCASTHVRERVRERDERELLSADSPAVFASPSLQSSFFFAGSPVSSRPSVLNCSIPFACIPSPAPSTRPPRTLPLHPRGCLNIAPPSQDPGKGSPSPACPDAAKRRTAPLWSDLCTLRSDFSGRER